MDKLDGIVKRLEAATVRLETLSHQKPSLAPKPGPTGGSSCKIFFLLTFLKWILANHVSEEVPPVVKNYDDEVDHLLNNFYNLCSKIGGDVAIMVKKFLEIFKKCLEWKDKSDFQWTTELYMGRCRTKRARCESNPGKDEFDYKTERRHQSV